MVTTIAAGKVQAAEVEALHDAAAQLPTGSQVRVMLDTLANALGRGVGAALLEQDTLLTPNQAAEVLGMSRPHLLTFMKAGALPYTMVGTHHRIAAGDLAAFAERRAAASKMVAEASATATQADQRTLAKMAPVPEAALAELDQL